MGAAGAERRAPRGTNAGRRPRGGGGAPPGPARVGSSREPEQGAWTPRMDLGRSSDVGPPGRAQERDPSGGATANVKAEATNVGR